LVVFDPDCIFVLVGFFMGIVTIAIISGLGRLVKDYKLSRAQVREFILIIGIFGACFSGQPEHAVWPAEKPQRLAGPVCRDDRNQPIIGS